MAGVLHASLWMGEGKILNGVVHNTVTMLPEREAYKKFIKKHIKVKREEKRFPGLKEYTYHVFKAPVKVQGELDEKVKRFFGKQKLGEVVVEIHLFDKWKKAFQPLGDEKTLQIKKMEEKGANPKDLIANISSFFPLKEIDELYRDKSKGRGVGGKVLDDILKDLRASGVKFVVTITPKQRMGKLLSSREFDVVEAHGPFKVYLKKIR